MESSNGTRTSAAGRRKRPRIAEENRKRAAKACHACRRLKEKCEGGIPCSRCKRLRQACHVDQEKIQQIVSHERQPESNFFDAERIRVLESIVRHHAPSISCDANTLNEYAVSLLSDRQNVSVPAQPRQAEVGSDKDDDEDYAIDPISSTTAVYTGELSHCHFSIHVRRRLNEGLSIRSSETLAEMPYDSDLSRAAMLHADRSDTEMAKISFPPREVADFLVEMFFEHAQTNYFYVDRDSLQTKLDMYFSLPEALRFQEVAWLCIVLMIFAIGTQFAHLSSLQQKVHDLPLHDEERHDNATLDDEVAVGFYRAAIGLIPDVIALASIESVQAFTLLAVYTLPIDPGGLSYTYLGNAIKVAISNGMHRKHKHGMDARIIELRNRVWWTAYTLEKRVCVLHGRPVSIHASEVDSNMPKKTTLLLSGAQFDTLPSILAMIRLTTSLERARDTIASFRRTSQDHRHKHMMSILSLSRGAKQYWATLSEPANVRRLDQNDPLFRFNAHLALTYHLVQVFIGRIFLLKPFDMPLGSDDTQGSVTRLTESQMELTNSCLESALEIISICQHLQDHVGLARASYTEFTSCRAAILVVLARRIDDRSTHLKDATGQGMMLLRNMSLGIYSAVAEKSAIEAMERAVRRLDNNNSTLDSSDRRYSRFKNWAMLWKNKTSPESSTPDSLVQSTAVQQEALPEWSNASGSPASEDFTNWLMNSSELPVGVDEFLDFR